MAERVCKTCGYFYEGECQYQQKKVLPDTPACYEYVRMATDEDIANYEPVEEE